MAGRKPKPTFLKLLQGNPGKRELPQNEPQPAKPKGAVPKAPRHLSDPARKQWRVVAKQLAGANILTELDAHALALYARRTPVTGTRARSSRNSARWSRPRAVSRCSRRFSPSRTRRLNR